MAPTTVTKGSRAFDQRGNRKRLMSEGGPWGAGEPADRITDFVKSFTKSDVQCYGGVGGMVKNIGRTGG